MSQTLPDAVEAYFRAYNAHDTDAASLCFTPDAIVRDDGEELSGMAAIREWIAASDEKYQATAQVTDSQEQGGETVVTGQVSGHFDGSPAELQFRFTLAGDKIAALTIL